VTVIFGLGRIEETTSFGNRYDSIRARSKAQSKNDYTNEPTAKFHKTYFTKNIKK